MTKWRGLCCSRIGGSIGTQAVPPPESGIGWGSASSSPGGLTDEAGEVAGAGEGVSEDRGLGAVGQAVPGRSFHTPAPLVGIAAFGVTETPNAQCPGRGIDLEVAGETDVAIGQGAVDDDGTAAREIWMLVGTMGGDKGKHSFGIRGWIAEEDIG